MARLKRPPGISVRTTLLAAGAFGLVVVGSAVLKTRHLSRVADRVAWRSPDFRMDRPGYDRLGFEATTDRNSRARAMFADGMVDVLHADDRGALASFLKAGAREPDWPMLRFYQGVSRLYLGFPVAAAADRQMAADAGFHPPEARTLWWLGLARLYCGETQEGYRLLQEIADSSLPQATPAREILIRIDRLTEDAP